MSTESPENELAVLRREMELSSLGDKPYSISADKLRRLIELESQASESPATLPAETHTLNDCQREGHYHIDTFGHIAERLCHCPLAANNRWVCASSLRRRTASVGQPEP